MTSFRAVPGARVALRKAIVEMRQTLEEDAAHVDGAPELSRAGEEALTVETQIEQARCDLEGFDIRIFEGCPGLLGRTRRDAE